jgi:hypothetical protein
MTTDNFCFYLQTILIQTSQTGGQCYSDTSPFSIPELTYLSTKIGGVELCRSNLRRATINGACLDVALLR